MDKWPEPVIPVQSISEGGVSHVPERYIKPPSQRPSLHAAAAPAAGKEENIPVFDLGAPEGEEEIVRRISEACRDWGFFQVVNHGVSREVVEKAREVWREFFNLPLEEKVAYANSPKTYEGYGSRLGLEKGAILDWGDYYFLYLQPAPVKNMDKWPARPASCRDVTDKYGEELRKLSGRVIRFLSMGLGLGEGYLQDAFGGEDAMEACLRVNYYPRCPQPDLTLGLSSHSDPGGLTLLLPDDHVDGLQVRRGDSWITVRPAAPDSIIVNVGDQIQVMSNTIYKSVEHRVVVNSSMERLSFAMFYNPKSDLLVAPAPSLVTDLQPAMYEPMSFNEYRKYIRTKGPQGKAQVESRKATIDQPRWGQLAIPA